MTGSLQEQISFYARMLMGVVVVAALVAVMAGRPAHASTTFTVTNTNDSGAGSLRAALDGANSNSGADTINFNIPGTGVHTIQPNLGKGSLPTITDPVTINGYSQPGASPNTLGKGTNAKLMIKLDGVGDLGTTGKGRGLDIDASNVVVKGLVIDHFAYGITVDDGASNARIEGNFIGTDSSGSQPKPNQYDGVYIYDRMGTTNNIVGGPTLAARNLISGNDYYGVEISSSGNRVSNNLIGTQWDGTSPLGNYVDGVYIFSIGPSQTAANNVIGGYDPANANTIAFNFHDGIALRMSSYSDSQMASGNLLLSNSVYSNGKLGIDLGYDGITPNDAGDTDTGVNHLQNWPVLSSAKKNAAGETTISGTLNSTPWTTFTIQFFKNSPGTYQGKTLLGYKNLHTDGTGNLSFTFSTTKEVKLGQNISATATSAPNYSLKDTSEFSLPKTVEAQ